MVYERAPDPSVAVGGMQVGASFSGPTWQELGPAAFRGRGPASGTSIQGGAAATKDAPGAVCASGPSAAGSLTFLQCSCQEARTFPRNSRCELDQRASSLICPATRQIKGSTA